MAGAVEVRQFAALCPAGTALAAPAIIALTMPVRTVISIRVRVPAGPNGNMGFAIGMGGAPVIPTQNNTFIVASDEIFDWTLDDLPNSGAWQAIMYNTGIFDHTIYLTFVCELPDQPAPDLTATTAAVAVLNAPATPTPVATDTDLPVAPTLQT
jgi:hypothetical protein